MALKELDIEEWLADEKGARSRGLKRVRER